MEIYLGKNIKFLRGKKEMTQRAFLTEQLERLRGEVGKMGVMDARLQLLERQLELVLREFGKGK